MSSGIAFVGSVFTEAARKLPGNFTRIHGTKCPYCFAYQGGRQAKLTMADELSQSDIERLIGEMNGTAADTSGGDSEQSAASPSLQSIRQASGSGGKFDQSSEMQAPVVLPLSKRRVAALLGRQPTSGYEVYDFRRSDRLSKEQVRSLQILHENFAQLYTSTLTAYLRTKVEVEIMSVEQLQYQEYVRSAGSNLVTVFDVEKLKGQVILDFDMPMIYAMFDRLLGGTGDVTMKAGKDLTDVEKTLTNTIIHRAVGDLESAWSTALPLEFVVSSMDASLQFLQVIPNTDTIILVMFDIAMGKQHGTLCLGIPYLALKPFASQLSTQRWATNAKRSSSGLAPKMASRLRENTPLSCIARLGTSSISVDAITSMQVGEILPLKISQGNGDDSVAQGSLAAVDLIIGSRPKFFGKIGLRGGKRLAVQIDGAIPPPTALEVHKAPRPA